jgi:YbgC/YbaW family acyl-CoA thioester hydrolase
MPHEFKVTRQVEFADTDTAGVVHFAAFFRYMEEAEHEFYRSLGESAYQWGPDGVIGMPRVSARCDFFRPLYYPDEVETHLTVSEKSSKAVGYDVVFRKAAGDSSDEVARGAMKVVYASRPHGAREWVAVDMPESLREAIQVAPESAA